MNPVYNIIVLREGYASAQYNKINPCQLRSMYSIHTAHQWKSEILIKGSFCETGSPPDGAGLDWKEKQSLMYAKKTSILGKDILNTQQAQLLYSISQYIKQAAFIKIIYHNLCKVNFEIIFYSLTFINNDIMNYLVKDFIYTLCMHHKFLLFFNIQ